MLIQLDAEAYDRPAYFHIILMCFYHIHSLYKVNLRSQRLDMLSKLKKCLVCID